MAKNEDKQNVVVEGGAGDFARNVLQRLTGRLYKPHHIDLSSRVGNIYLVDINEDAMITRADEFGIPRAHLATDFSQLHREDLDLAINATTASAHYDTTIPLVEANLPFFLCKPVDADYEKAEELAAIVYNSDVLNASGSDMVQHPALVRAMQYLIENDAQVKHVDVKWTKNRDRRVKPIVGIMEEEGPHAFSVLKALMPYDPYKIYSVSRNGPIAVDPTKWKKYGQKQGMPVLDDKFLLQTGNKSEDRVLVQIPTASTTMIKYWGTDSEGNMPTAVVTQDFEDPYKQRVVTIVAELPEGSVGEGEPFSRYVTIRVDMTDVPSAEKEHAPYVQPGIFIVQGAVSPGGGIGKLVMNESVDDADTIGAQLEAMFDYAQTGVRPTGLSSVIEAYEAEDLASAAVCSVDEDALFEI